MVKGDFGSWKLTTRTRKAVLGAVAPTAKERKSLAEVCQSLLARVRMVIDDLELEGVEPILAGSAAKGTMMKGPDIDVFIIFPEGTAPDVLEEKGLRIGTLVLEDPQKRYTQHPYITGSFLGTNCDIVPCLAIPKGSRVRTAVDRTPYHTVYINSRMNDLQKEDVLLLKSFLKGIGAYGAEDTVQGCSGYLVELLVLKFDTFDGVVQWFAGMDIDAASPGGCEEIEGTRKSSSMAECILFDKGPLLDETPLALKEYRKMFDQDILIVVDPVDSRRNVASPVSAQTLSYISRSSRQLMESEGTGFFHPFSGRPHGETARKEAKIAEGENLFLLELPAEDPGVVITQLRRSLRKLAEGMSRKGFDEVQVRYLLCFPKGYGIDPSYLKSRYIWSGPIGVPTIMVRIETTPSFLPREYIHWGPPLDNPRFSDFSKKWGSEVKVDKERGRGFVTLDRDVVDPSVLAIEEWTGSTHGSSFIKAEPRPLDRASSCWNLVQVLREGCDPWGRKV